MLDVRVHILAGGRSSRFGSDKALAIVHGRPLLLHVADLASQLGLEVTIVADCAEKYAHLNLPTIVDRVPQLGPLGGLHTALAASPPNSHVLLLPCDVLGLRPAWLEELIAADATAAAVLFDMAPLQPLVGRYAARLLEPAGRALSLGERAMHRFVAGTNPLLLAPPRDWETLRNINRPEELSLHLAACEHAD